MKVFRDYLRTTKPSMVIHRGGVDFLIYKVDKEDWTQWVGKGENVDYTPDEGNTYATTVNDPCFGYAYDGFYLDEESSYADRYLAAAEAIIDFLVWK